VNIVYRTALEIQEFFEQRGWRFCIIGGIAVQQWGESRVTDDVDITLMTGFGGEEPFIDELLSWLNPARPDAKEFAQRRRVLLLRHPNGVKVDIAMAAFPFENSATERAQKIEMAPGCHLRICGPEDLIVFKTFAARPLDLHDVEMVIVRQGDANLDWRYIHEQLTPLLELKEAPDLLTALETMRAKIRRRQGCPAP
jgi:predicted nucleotidyltransferase